MKSIRRYVNIFKGVRIPWLLLVVVFVLSIIQSYTELMWISLRADVIDTSQNAIALDKLVQFLTALVGSACVSVAATYFGNLAYEKINRGVRVKLWNKVMHLPTRYYDGESGDSLVSRVTTDASQSYLYVSVAINLITTVYATVVAVRRMYSYSAELTRLMVFLIPVCVIAAALAGKLNHAANLKAQTTFSGTLAYLVERTRYLRLIKAARTEYREQKEGAKKFNRQFRVSFLSVLSNASLLLIAEIFNCSILVISFVLGGRLALAGEITIGRLVGFYSLGGVLYLRLAMLLMYYTQLKGANGRLKKIAQVMEAPDEKDEGVELDVADEDLVISDVSFAYQEKPVLKDVSFRIPQGQVTAIVGSNGAGKSTLFKLLERMYDPDEGELRFGGTDVREFNLRSWRQSFGIVTQDPALLSGTIRENILYGVQRKVSEEELVHVAKLANAYDFIMETPGGFDARVGSNGSNFSGGQRQCIAIARAMMRNPDYLLLVEASSNLDAKSEKLVSEALANLMQGRTTVMIAHSYSATRSAGHIVVMRDGRVEAEGTPEELLETNEYYRIFAGKAAG